jgi:outer membrane protein TolC
MRAGSRIVAAALLASGCASLWRPEGDGGWSASRRTEELGRLAERAGVDLEASPAPAPPAPRTLDLPTALAMATDGNRRIAISRRELEAAAEEVRAVRSQLLPTTVGTGRYTWYTDELRNRVPLPTGVGAGPNSAIVIRDQDFGTVNGTLALPIDLSGELRHALGAAQAGYRGERARVWATTLDQQLTVARAYFDLLEADRLREVTEQNVALYREQLANAESRFANGQLTKNQLLVVQVALQSGEEERQQRALAIARARYALNGAIGADVNAPTEPADVTERPAVPSAEDALRAAYVDNPLLLSLVEEQQRLEETARSLELGWLPRVTGGGAIDYSSSQLLEPSEFGSGFVGFTWNLDTDGRRAAEVAQARLAAERNRLEIERQLRELEALVRTTQQAASERLAALALAEKAVGQAQENLRIRRQQFDAGRASSEDVLDAQALVSNQRALRASALYQAHVRLAELRSLMGRGLADESRGGNR